MLIPPQTQHNAASRNLINTCALLLAELWGLVFVILGRTADLSATYLEFVFNKSIASWLSQIVIFASFVIGVSFLVHWCTAYMSELCLAVLSFFPESHLELYQIRLTLQFDVYSTLCNICACCIFAFICLIMCCLRIALILGAHPIACFWISSIGSVCIALCQSIKSEPPEDLSNL